MPTITATTIIGKAQLLAQDTTSVRWAVSEWLGWLNDGQREICIIRPTAFTKLVSVSLVAGTKQTLPADGVQFIEYIRSMGVAGLVPGAIARKVPRRLMDAQVPGWHSATATNAASQFILDPSAPKNFYVYPPATGTTQAEILYAAMPPNVAAVGDLIALDDVYSNALLDYLMYRAYSKDNEFIGNAERSVLYRKQFESSLGMKTDASTTVAR